MRNSGGDTLPQTEGVSTHKVGTITVRIVKGVEEEGSGGAEEVLDVLPKCIDGFPRRITCNLSIKILKQINPGKEAVMNRLYKKKKKKRKKGGAEG